MHTAYERNKYGTDKLALLGLFVVALAFAQLIVSLRSAIRLSPPVELKHTGLSVSMPSGNGWHCEKQWTYRKDHYDLNSFFTIGSGGIHPQARCRYLLADANRTPQELFNGKAEWLRGQITGTGQMAESALTIDWAHIHEPGTLTELFVGTAALPDSRTLEVEVFQPASEGELAERAFKRILGSIKFQENTLLKAGTELITGIKDRGLNGILQSSWPYYYDPQVFFLINDARGRTIGFATDVLAGTGSASGMNIQAASYQYIRGKAASEHTTFLKSDDRFEGFFLKSETSGRSGRSGSEISRRASGEVTVREFGVRGVSREKKYLPGPAVVPDILLDVVLIQMLDGGENQIMLDMIRTDGSIAPLVVSKSDAGRSGPGPKAAYALTLDVLDGQNHKREIYFDEGKHILKIIIRQEETFTLRAANLETVLQQFPERADYLLHQK